MGWPAPAKIPLAGAAYTLHLAELAADAALDTRVTANATKIQELALSIQDAVNTVKNELQAKTSVNSS